MRVRAGGEEGEGRRTRARLARASGLVGTTRGTEGGTFRGNSGGSARGQGWATSAGIQLFLKKIFCKYNFILLIYINMFLHIFAF